MAIKTERDHDVIYFSTAGGIEVEENWETVQEMQVPLGDLVSDIAKNETIQVSEKTENGLLRTSQ